MKAIFFLLTATLLLAGDPSISTNSSNSGRYQLLSTRVDCTTTVGSSERLGLFRIDTATGDTDYLIMVYSSSGVTVLWKRVSEPASNAPIGIPTR